MDKNSYIINHNYEFFNDETNAFQKEPYMCKGPYAYILAYKKNKNIKWIRFNEEYTERVLKLIAKRYKFKESTIIITRGNINYFDR